MVSVTDATGVSLHLETDNHPPAKGLFPFTSRLMLPTTHNELPFECRFIQHAQIPPSPLPKLEWKDVTTRRAHGDGRGERCKTQAILEGYFLVHRISERTVKNIARRGGVPQLSAGKAGR